MEDLFQNPFFRALKTKELNPFWLQAEKNCWLVLIPQAMTLGQIKFTPDFTKTHILKPSRFFTGEYETLNDQQVELSENVIKTKKGFPETRTVRVMFEELFYNKQYQQFKVFCIDQPLVGGTGSDETIKFPEKSTYESCVRFLESFPVNEIVLQKVKRDVNEFNNSYVFVEGFEQHLQEKVRTLCSQANEALMCANPDFRVLHKISGPNLTRLSQIIESYVMGILHEKVFEACLASTRTKDERLYMLLDQYQKLSQKSLDIEPDLQGDYSEACKILQRLEFGITPFEKLNCMQDTTNAIARKVAALGQQCGKEYVLTTDNLLPLLVWVIIQAKSLHLHSNIHYAEKFTFSNITTTNFGFTLITFQAAISFLENNQLIPSMQFDFPQIPSKRSTMPSPNSTNLFPPSTSPEANAINKIFATPFSSRTTPDTKTLSISASSTTLPRQTSAPLDNKEKSPLKRTSSLQVGRSSSSSSSSEQIGATSLNQKSSASFVFKPAPQVISINKNQNAPDKLGGFLSSFIHK